jgi:hypothetical protein
VNHQGHLVDCIYIAASARDARYTRICVASVRYFYPEVPIRLLISGSLQWGLTEELQRYWNVRAADLSSKGNYGWGFVKLEPLFGPRGKRFLVLDSDTVLTGPVLGVRSDSEAPFLVDEEEQSEDDTQRLYYDWRKVRAVDPSAQPPAFVFNSGQWFGTAGVLTRADFASWVEWTMPRRLRHPKLFMPGDQGVLNYVLNQKAVLGAFPVECRQIMRWPAHSMDGLDAENVAKGTAVPRIVHWAGLKKARQRDMLGANLLAFFEKVYYSRLPAGQTRRIVASCRNALTHWLIESEERMKLALHKLAKSGRAPLRKTVPATK